MATEYQANTAARTRAQSDNSPFTDSPILNGLTTDEQGQVNRLLQFETFNSGHTIVREREIGRNLWMLVSGRCVVVKTLKDGSEQQLGLLKPGTVFGEVSFLHAGSHCATIRALEEAETTRLSHEDFEELARLNPSAANHIVQNAAGMLAERFRDVNDYAVNVAQQLWLSSHNLNQLCKAYDDLPKSDLLAKNSASETLCRDTSTRRIGFWAKIALLISLALIAIYSVYDAHSPAEADSKPQEVKPIEQPIAETDNVI